MKAKASRPAPLSIRFTAKLVRPAEGDGWLFLILPAEASAGLPSRGMVAVEGTLNGEPFQAMLEPDGQGSHWMKVVAKLGGAAGDAVELEIVPMAEEPEPEVPEDFAEGLAAAEPGARAIWADITPAARRDWIHWIVSPKKAETRIKRIVAGCSMLGSGKRRPCCFDRSGQYSKSLSAPKAADFPSRAGGG